VTFIYYGNEIGMRQMPEDWPQVEGAIPSPQWGADPHAWARGKNLGFPPRLPIGSTSLWIPPGMPRPSSR